MPELQWLIGIAVSVLLGIGTIAFAAFRAVSGQINGAVAEMRKAVKDGDHELHERVNRLRQDVSDNYVRRVDLDSHMSRIDGTLKEVRDDQKQIMRSLASLEAGRPRA